MYHLFFIYYQISLVILLGSDLYDLLANAQCYFTAANVPLYYSLYHNWFYQPGFYFIDCCHFAARKTGPSKQIALEYDLSCIIRKDEISFPRKYDLML